MISSPDSPAKTITVRQPLTLDDGENAIEVVAYNAKGLIASVPVVLKVAREGPQAAVQPRLYVFTVGVNDYYDGRLRLTYAAPDATALADALQRAGEKIYERIELKTVLDADVSVANLDKIFAELSQRVRSQDVFVFFIAGHGKTVDGRYYFLPHFRYQDEDSIVRRGIGHFRPIMACVRMRARRNSTRGITMRVVAAFACAVMLVCLGALPSYAEKRVALVIGNDHYANLPSDEQLRKAVNDARTVGDALATLGFEVVRGENLGRQALVDKFDEFTQRLSPGDTAFFFFSGHGVSINGGNYILPADVPNATVGQDMRLVHAAFGESDIVTELQGRGVRVAVVVLDACRNNPFKRPGGKGVGTERGLGRVEPVQGVFTLYSAGLGQTALDRLSDADTNPNSLFTRVFVPALVTPGLDLKELAGQVRENVAQLASTVQHNQRPAYYDETVGGRIYLAGLPASGTQIPTGQPLAVDPAAQAWGVTQNTTSAAVLEDFIRQFGSTPYGSMARARLDELKRLAAVPPPAQPPASATRLTPEQERAAQAYPSRPVRLMVGYPPGGGSDIMARLLGQQLAERLGQAFVVENRAGAAGNIAAEAVTKSPADGYTLLLCGGVNTINTALYDKLNFNFSTDIAPVATIARTPLVMEVNPSVPARTVSEFVTYAKANPGKLAMASAGVGTLQHLTGELFKVKTGVDLVHVPYHGAVPMLTDLIGGQVQVAFDSLTTSGPHIKAGKVRALAVATATRLETLPEIPTMGDFVPGFEASSWYGVCGPKGIPPEIVTKLNKEINAALADSKIKDMFDSLGIVTFVSSPSDLGRLIAEETQKWAGVVKSAGIKLQ
ncbi:MAG: tripartite tricarboxylate transporter substrate-binding protein [Xanthobacteraceae bacterium]